MPMVHGWAGLSEPAGSNGGVRRAAVLSGEARIYLGSSSLERSEEESEW